MSSYSYYLFIGTVTEADATTPRHAAKTSQTGWQETGPVRINQMQPDRQDAENIDPKAPPKHADCRSLIFVFSPCCSASCFCLWLLGFGWNLYAWIRKCALLQFISHLEETASTLHRDQWELCVSSCCLCEHAGVALFISLVVISEHILWLMAAFGLQPPLLFAVFVLNQTEFLPHFTVETRCYKL